MALLWQRNKVEGFGYSVVCSSLARPAERVWGEGGGGPVFRLELIRKQPAMKMAVIAFYCSYGDI